MRVTGATKILGVIGNPVKHSLSPFIHNLCYERLGIDAVYLPFEQEEAYFEKFLDGVCFLNNAVGFNVTVPFKERAFKAMDFSSKDAQVIGAVNVIKRGEKKLIGYNTDWEGFLESLKLNKVGIPEIALVFGAGGAAKAVVYALLKSGVKRIYISNRSSINLKLFLERFRDSKLRPVPWDRGAVRQVIKEVDMVINTTSLGMDGVSMPPVDFEDAHGTLVVYDVIYQPRETPLLKEAKRCGLKAVNGLDMLISQALLSMEIWFGKSCEFEFVRGAVLKHLEDEV